MKLTLKFAFVFLFLSFLTLRPTASYADGHWHGHEHEHGYVGVNIGLWSGPYYGYGYRNPYYDPYYDPYYVPAYTVVESSNYQPVVVNGTTYYVNNGVYYIYTQNGYQVVATPLGVNAPVVVQAASPVTTIAPVDMDAITVNVPNNKGGYTAVVLKKSGTGYTGPQGEFYAEFPKVSQLQVMYGK